MDLITSIFGKPVNAISADQAQKLLSQKQKVFLLDVRQPEEYRGGHIPGARLIPLGELRSRMNELPQDRDILVICHSGNRSLSATRQLANAGYKVMNVNGGMIAWSRSGFPVTKGKA